MKHGNISVFIPHLGCPHDCVFCNQRRISGTKIPPAPHEVDEIVAQALSIAGGGRDYEIAFFGGSFTAIERGYMIALLDSVQKYRDKVKGIRVSTRPDAIDEETLEILKEKGVTDIELGVQSMDDRVLSACERGHTAQDTVNASRLIRSFNIGLGHQMMTGLPKDTADGAVYTAKEIIKMHPDTVRIYPTLVMRDTALEQMYKSGAYTPQTVDEAVTLCSELIPMFEDAGVSVIRVGLHSDGIENGLVAGPFHPAFGELCESRIYRKLMQNAIDNAESFGGSIYVAESELSKAIGQHRENIAYFENKTHIQVRIIGDKTLNKREIRI